MTATPIDHVVLGRPGALVIIGVFDGVHAGHVSLVHEAARRAQVDRSDLVALVVDRVDDAPRLTNVRRRCELLVHAGASGAVVIRVAAPAELPERVGDALRSLRPSRILIDREALGPSDRRAIAALADGPDGAIAVDDFDVVNDPVYGPVTAPLILGRVAGGEVDVAQALMGRPFELEATLEYPPATNEAGNMLRCWLTPSDHEIVAPGPGAYEALVRIESRWFPSIVVIDPDRDRAAHEMIVLDPESIVRPTGSRLVQLGLLRRLDGPGLDGPDIDGPGGLRRT